MAGSDASVGLGNNWWRNQAYGRQTSHGVGQIFDSAPMRKMLSVTHMTRGSVDLASYARPILPEAGHLSSRSLSQALLTGPVWVPEPKTGPRSLNRACSRLGRAVFGSLSRRQSYLCVLLAAISHNDLNLEET